MLGLVSETCLKIAADELKPLGTHGVEIHPAGAAKNPDPITGF
jgi:hypothetical protein